MAVHLSNGMRTIDMENIIKRGNNLILTPDGTKVFRSYTALSYVSHGKTDTNSRSLMMSNGEIAKARASDDIDKYIAAMKYIGRDRLLWTDEVSVDKDNYDKFGEDASIEYMRAIGRGYTIAEQTLAIVNDVDRVMLKLAVESLTKLSELMEYNVDKEILSKIYSEMRESAINRSPYSYWARAWTMQEQHLANNVMYTYVDGGELKEIVSSNYISNIIGSIVKKMHNRERSKDEVGALNSIIHESLNYITGKQSASVLSYGRSEITLDGVLFLNLSNNVRCARNRPEFQKALAIALNIYESSDEMKWYRIMQKAVAEGYLPTVANYSVNREVAKSWWPKGTDTASVHGELYYSTNLLQLQPMSKMTDQVIMTMNEGGSLTIRAHVVRLRLTNVVERANNGREQVLAGVELIPSKEVQIYEATAEIENMSYLDLGKVSVEVSIVSELAIKENDTLLGIFSSVGIHAVVCGQIVARISRRNYAIFDNEIIGGTAKGFLVPGAYILLEGIWVRRRSQHG